MRACRIPITVLRDVRLIDSRSPNHAVVLVYRVLAKEDAPMQLESRFITARALRATFNARASLVRAAQLSRFATHTSLGVFGLALFATTAAARPCQRSTDCPAHFSCEAIAQTGCAAPAACPDGGPCPVAPPCEANDVKVCVSPDCRRDDDCPSDMICYRDADARTCIPAYLAPCERASDCGDGFTCDEIVGTHCHVTGGSGGTSSTSQCTTRGTGQYHCQLQVKGCSGANDCPNGFSCGANPALAECSDSDDAGVAPDAGGTCASTSTSPVCLPPYAATDFALPGALPNANFDDGNDGQGAPPVQRRGWHSGCAVAALGITGSSPHALLAWFGVLAGLALAVRKWR
jgi:hypothetical protein